jgi:hypothetical protein
MRHSTIAAKEEDMATLHGGQIVRQYCNKRTRIKETEICTSAQGKEEQASIFASSVEVEDSRPAFASELKLLSDSKLTASQPQVIVRKFSLPPFSRAYSLPVRPKKDTDFGKPKQRWKQLCNLQHEMTTTLGVSRVKMRAPSTPLTQEYRPGTLQSYVAGTLDIMNSTLQRLLTGTETPTKSKEGNSVPCESTRTKTASSDGAVDPKFDNVDVDEILETAEQVPEVAAIAEVSSAGGTVRFAPFDTAHSNIRIGGGKIVIFQPLAIPKQIVQQESGNTVVLKSPPSAAVEAASGKRVVKAFVGQKDAARSLLKTKLMQGNVKSCGEVASKENGVEQKNLKLCLEPVMKEQNVVWASVKHNKEQNVIWANQKHNSEPNMKQQTIVRGDMKHASEVFKNEQNGKLGNSKNDTEAGGTEQKGADEDSGPSCKEQNVAQGNLKTATGTTAKEVSLVTVEPTASPRQPAEDWKQMEQLHLEIMNMKRRRSIAMKVEREVLRAKDIKLVQEVLLPARKVLLSEMGTQTNLFSLVEPGRMVEMRITTDRTGK